MRARDLAEKAGCAVGAIYNAVDDLDQLVLLVNMRTLAALEQRADHGARRKTALRTPWTPPSRNSSASRSPISPLRRRTRRDGARCSTIACPGREVPEWYRNEQHRLFRHVEGPLRVLQPHAPPKRRALLARSLFSAVHGLVRLGLEEKLQAIPLTVLREQMTFFVTTIGRGMTSADNDAQ